MFASEGHKTIHTLHDCDPILLDGVVSTQRQQYILRDVPYRVRSWFPTMPLLAQYMIEVRSVWKLHPAVSLITRCRLQARHSFHDIGNRYEEVYAIPS